MRAWNFVTFSPFGKCAFELTRRSNTAARTATTAFPSEFCCGVVSMFEVVQIGFVYMSVFVSVAVSMCLRWCFRDMLCGVAVFGVVVV